MPGPSDKPPYGPDSVVLPEHGTVDCLIGPAVATGIPVPAEGAPDELYVASNPARCTDASDEKTTYSCPFDDDVTVAEDRVPVMASARGADAEAPLYTLIKS